jgi:hypothetical protein
MTITTSFNQFEIQNKSLEGIHKRYSKNYNFISDTYEKANSAAKKAFVCISIIFAISIFTSVSMGLLLIPIFIAYKTNKNELFSKRAKILQNLKGNRDIDSKEYLIKKCENLTLSKDYDYFYEKYVKEIANNKCYKDEKDNNNDNLINCDALEMKIIIFYLNKV